MFFFSKNSYKHDFSFSLFFPVFLRGLFVAFLSFLGFFLLISLLWYSPFDPSLNSAGFLGAEDRSCFYDQRGFSEDLLRESAKSGDQQQSSLLQSYCQYYGGSPYYGKKQEEEDYKKNLLLYQQHDFSFQERWKEYFDHFSTLILKNKDFHESLGPKVHNIFGLPGAFVADFFFQWLGYGSFLLSFFLFSWVVIFFFGFSFMKIAFFFFLLLLATLLCQEFFFPMDFPFPFLSKEKMVSYCLEGPSVTLWNPKHLPNALGVLFLQKNIYLFYILVFFLTSFSLSFFLPFFLRARGRFFLLWLQQYQKKIKKKKEIILSSSPKKKQRSVSSLVSLKSEVDIRSAHSQKEEKEKNFRTQCPSFQEKKKPSFLLPPLSLLTCYNSFSLQTQDLLLDSLAKVLQDFGIKGEILGGYSGPIVTLYEFMPAPGVKASRIISLSDDIARSMGCFSARISTVPGKNVVGIELSNKTRSVVHFKDLLLSPEYKDHQGELPIILGRDISGKPIIVDLAKMPHVLIAGTTGSGKSVGINAMILSLLFRFTPLECRFIMIDPKMLELSIYNGIPHLLEPVIIDPQKAVESLEWVVVEMKNRYRLMSQLSVRNIVGYNQKISRIKDQKPEAMEDFCVQVGFDENRRPILEEKPKEQEPLPYIVVVIDEMADLMLTAGKDIENLVQQLAQMARAAGIHLMMATQRPSVDVITGTIKANFPTRISFQVASKIDSRTILGEQGAEHLLGQGDMLYMSPGGRTLRVHGPFVSDEDISSVVHFFSDEGSSQLSSMDSFSHVFHGKKNSEPYEPRNQHDKNHKQYQEEKSHSEDNHDPFLHEPYDPYEEYNEDMEAQDLQNLEPMSQDSSSFKLEEDDETLYERSVLFVRREQKVSLAALQNHLHIGYNKAFFLVEEMEKNRVISPPDYLGKRHVL